MAKNDSLKYRAPDDWFAYDAASLIKPVSSAEAAIHALTSAPFRRVWLESSGSDQLHDEITSSCRITAPDEGGAGNPTVEAAARTYAWISEMPAPPSLSLSLIRQVHSQLTENKVDISSALRAKGEQIFFGSPRQRGAKGGKECQESLEALVAAWTRQGAHQPRVVKSLSLHYHILSIHPFHDANGRTARALETIVRGAAGLKGAHFVSMASYYLEERAAYEHALSASRRRGHDLTPFLEFTLHGLTARCDTLFAHVRNRLATTVFEQTMVSLFDRLRAGKRQAMATRQVQLLRSVLGSPGMSHQKLYEQLRVAYEPLKNPWKAFLRDMHDLIQIRAVEVTNGIDPSVYPCLTWPTIITEELFFQHYRDAPRSGVALWTAV